MIEQRIRPIDVGRRCNMPAQRSRWKNWWLVGIEPSPSTFSADALTSARPVTLCTWMQSLPLRSHVTLLLFQASTSTSRLCRVFGIVLRDSIRAMILVPISRVGALLSPVVPAEQLFSCQARTHFYCWAQLASATTGLLTSAPIGRDTIGLCACFHMCWIVATPALRLCGHVVGSITSDTM